MEHMVPNLFIPGAARCGTTSLYAILRQHPEIHGSLIKEPTYFNWPWQYVANPFEYFGTFASAKRYRMDGSANYLANRQTPAVLQALFPNARFIISLRDPKARAHSLFRLMRSIGSEEIPDFASALNAESARFTSYEFFSSCRFDFWNYMYTRSSMYDIQLTRYLSFFDRSQFHFLTLADLIRDPAGTTKRILEFLDLDPAPSASFNYDRQAFAVSDGCKYDAESDKIMDSSFDGLTKRTDRLVGCDLDWSA